MSSTRKRNFADALDSSEGGQDDEGCLCKVAKVDADTKDCELELLQDEYNQADELTHSYLDLTYPASPHANETPPLFDFVADTASLSSSSSHSAPLTEENLLALDQTMPAKKESGSGAATESSTVTVSRAFEILELNNIFVDNKSGAERGQDIIQEAKRIIHGPRHSVMTDAQAETIRETASKLALDDELTFIAGVWKLVIDTHREVEFKNTQDKVDYVETAWDKDNLKCNWSSPFASTLAPPLRFADPAMEALADSVPKLKNSVPDLTYGYGKDTFTPTQMVVNEIVKGELSRRNWHAFLVGEAKSIDLPIYLGIAQVARAAATVISLKRNLNEEAKPSVITGSRTSKSSSSEGQHSVASSTTTLQHDTASAILASSGGITGPDHGQRRYRADKSSFIFTFAISPEKARLFVAWAEEEWVGNNQAPGINYYMEGIRGYYFEEGAEHWVALHHDLDNVLDWGVGPRKTEVLNLLNDIANKKKDGKKRERA